MSVDKPVIVVLMGLPGSGKTHFSKLIQTKLSTCTLITFDDLIPIAKQKQLADESKWKEERQRVIQQMDQYLSGNEVLEISDKKFEHNSILIIDDNNYYQSMRYSYFQLARKYHLGYCQFYLDASVTLSQGRNAQRQIDERVPDHIITQMKDRLEAPNPLKNSWEQFSFSISVSDNVDIKSMLEMSLQMIKTASKNPVPALSEEAIETRKNEARAKCNASIIHQVDKILRKQVSLNLKGTEKEQLKDEAKRLNAIKDEVLEDLRTGFSEVPKEAHQGMAKKDLEPLKEAILTLFSLKLNDS